MVYKEDETWNNQVSHRHYRWFALAMYHRYWNFRIWLIWAGMVHTSYVHRKVFGFTNSLYVYLLPALYICGIRAFSAPWREEIGVGPVAGWLLYPLRWRSLLLKRIWNIFFFSAACITGGSREEIGVGAHPLVVDASQYYLLYALFLKIQNFFFCSCYYSCWRK